MKIFRNPRVYLLLAITSFLLSSLIALDTNNYHPDETMHIDAFCYFEQHWWSPTVDSDEVAYGPDGWSRVYNGEVVYQVYGRLSRLISLPRVAFTLRSERFPTGFRIHLPLVFSNLPQRLSSCHQTTYRLLNSCLLLITLFLLFCAGTRHSLATVIALTLVGLPQVIYLYSYANSDAWGLSFSLFVFLFALVYERPLATWRRIMGLGLLTGVVLLSKQPFWVSLPFSYALIAWNVLKHRESAGFSVLLRPMLILILLIFCVVAPLKIITPWVRGYSSAALEEMRERRARVDYRPSDPTAGAYRLAAKGWRLTQLLGTYGSFWMENSAVSFYGLFGYMDVRLPRSVYAAFTAVVLFSLSVTYGILIHRWSVVPDSLRLLLLLAPLAFGLSVLSSLYNSWTYDVQAQGRYLFSALAPFAVMLNGAVDLEPPSLSNARAVIWIALFLLSIFVLWRFVLYNPVFH